jgi:hypothetical protein
MIPVWVALLNEALQLLSGLKIAQPPVIGKHLQRAVRAMAQTVEIAEEPIILMDAERAGDLDAVDQAAGVMRQLFRIAPQGQLKRAEVPQRIPVSPDNGPRAVAQFRAKNARNENDWFWRLCLCKAGKADSGQDGGEQNNHETHETNSQ